MCAAEGATLSEKVVGRRAFLTAGKPSGWLATLRSSAALRIVSHVSAPLATNRRCNHGPQTPIYNVLHFGTLVAPCTITRLLLAGRAAALDRGMCALAQPTQRERDGCPLARDQDSGEPLTSHGKEQWGL